MAKILLVEDNEMNRDMLSRRLIRNGYEVSIAIDGQQGVDMAISQRPDLILMDMSLPVIDGWEATRQIKANDVTRKIPVIALTAHAMAGDREKAMEAGCDDYDTKPVEMDASAWQDCGLACDQGGLSGQRRRRRVGTGSSVTTDLTDQGADRRTERALVAYVRQELSAPAIAIMGYAEMLMDDAVQAGREQVTDDLQRILDASRTLHRLILSLLDPATVHRTDGSADLAEYRRTLRHDLRTPINAIKGYGEMLREDAADGGARHVSRRSRQAPGRGNPTARPDRRTGNVFRRAMPRHRMERAPPPPSLAHRRRWSRACSRRSAPSPKRKRTARPVQPSRILVVDDNASNRDLLSRRLQRQGHTVLQAEDGTIALALVEKEALDLVLLDLMMPGISGYDVLISLKNNPRFREIPVIMISALSELDSIVRCIEAGADDYLAKPFDPTLLRARVGSSLEKKHLRDREREMVEALRLEKERSEQLLLNILPREIVTRMNGGETDHRRPADPM